LFTTISIFYSFFGEATISIDIRSSAITSILRLVSNNNVSKSVRMLLLILPAVLSNASVILVLYFVLSDGAVIGVVDEVLNECFIASLFLM
jgi:hypothetical protein